MISTRESGGTLAGIKSGLRRSPTGRSISVTSFHPDSTLDGTPQALTLLPNGVRLTTSLSRAFGLQIIRSITLKPGQPRLYLTQSLVRPRPMRPCSLSVWNVTQIRGDATLFPSTVLSPQRRLAGTRAFRAAASRLSLLAHGAQNAHRRAGPVVSHKVGSAGRAGWIAALYGGRFVLSEHFPVQAGRPYPDGGCGIEVYTNGADVRRTDLAYNEIETLGPLFAVRPFRPATLSGYWQINRLARISHDDADAARLIRAVARKHP